VTLPVYPSKIFGLKPNVVKTRELSTIVQSGDDPGNVTTIPQVINPVWHFNLIYEQVFNDPGPNPAFTNPSYTATELDTLMGFDLAQGGPNGMFLFDDPEDDTVTLQPLQLVNDGATPPNWYTPIQKLRGDPTVAQFYEDITDLNPQNFSGLVVKANGLTASSTTDYSVGGPGLALPGYSFLGLYLQWKAWQTSHNYSVLGTLLIDPAGHLQKITTAGISGSSEPAFNDSGSTTTDGAAVWTDQGVAVISASFGFYFRVRFEDDKLDFEKFLYHLYTIGGTEGQRGSGMVKLMTRRPVLGP